MYINVHYNISMVSAFHFIDRSEGSSACGVTTSVCL